MMVGLFKIILKFSKDDVLVDSIYDMTRVLRRKKKEIGKDHRKGNPTGSSR